MRMLVLVILASIGGHATAADFAMCNEAGTQLELNACAADDFEKADKELNEAYSELLRERRDEPVFVKRMRAAQKAWLAFRDAELEAIFACEDANPRICWGSMYPMSYSFEKARLTRERTQALRAILREGLED
jgi:uncharacterized protein YecT (DUF1311 family)